MFRFEWISAAYFVLLGISGLIAPVALRRRLRAIAASCAIVVGIAAAQALPEELRVWLPHAYLVLGYRVPAMLVTPREYSGFEAWLQRHDAAWRRHTEHLTRPIAALLELMYLACYIVVPMAFLAVWVGGTSEHVEQFWAAVLLAGFTCYVTLPWLISRPPRKLSEEPGPRARLASVNARLLRAVSHEMNTFPSGHVAVATAAALALLPVSRAAALVLAIAAAGIAAGAAAGRYHYGIDVIAGAAVGIAAATLVL